MAELSKLGMTGSVGCIMHARSNMAEVHLKVWKDCQLLLQATRLQDVAVNPALQVVQLNLHGAVLVLRQASASCHVAICRQESIACKTVSLLPYREISCIIAIYRLMPAWHILVVSAEVKEAEDMVCFDA